MHAEDFFIDDGSNRKAVEAVSKGLPQLYIVSSLALIVKSINTVNRCTFVVSSQEEEILWVLYFVSKE